jgi:hypothetical protein
MLPGTYFYHERQQGQLCRMHAVNNALGYRAYDPDEWKTRLLDLGQALGQGGALVHDDMMFYGGFLPISIMVEQKQDDWVTMAFGGSALKILLERSSLSELLDTSIRRMIIYQTSHTWAMRGDVDARWFNLDSQQAQPHMFAESDTQLFAHGLMRTLVDTAATGTGGIIFIASLQHALKHWISTVTLAGYVDVAARIRKRMNVVAAKHLNHAQSQPQPQPLPPQLPSPQLPPPSPNPTRSVARFMNVSEPVVRQKIRILGKAPVEISTRQSHPPRFMQPRPRTQSPAANLSDPLTVINMAKLVATATRVTPPPIPQPTSITFSLPKFTPAVARKQDNEVRVSLTTFSVPESEPTDDEIVPECPSPDMQPTVVDQPDPPRPPAMSLMDHIVAKGKMLGYAYEEDPIKPSPWATKHQQAWEEKRNGKAGLLPGHIPDLQKLRERLKESQGSPTTTDTAPAPAASKAPAPAASTAPAPAASTAPAPAASTAPAPASTAAPASSTGTSGEQGTGTSSPSSDPTNYDRKTERTWWL